MAEQLPELDPRFGEADLSQPAGDTYVAGGTPPSNEALDDLRQMVKSGQITPEQADRIADQLLQEL